MTDHDPDDDRDPDEVQRDRDLAIVKRHARSLMECFENVQIFATRHNPDGDSGGGTIAVNWGLGNWYARFGQVREWMIQEQARAAEQVRRCDCDEDDE